MPRGGKISEAPTNPRKAIDPNFVRSLTDTYWARLGNIFSFLAPVESGVGYRVLKNRPLDPN